MYHSYAVKLHSKASGVDALGVCCFTLPRSGGFGNSVCVCVCVTCAKTETPQCHIRACRDNFLLGWNSGLHPYTPKCIVTLCFCCHTLLMRGGFEDIVSQLRSDRKILKITKVGFFDMGLPITPSHSAARVQGLLHYVFVVTLCLGALLSHPAYEKRILEHCVPNVPPQKVLGATFGPVGPTSNPNFFYSCFF